MRLALAFLVFFMFGNNLFGQNDNIQFDRLSFYNAISSESTELIDKQLGILETSGISEKEAFKGALLMKKAGLTEKPSERLSLFKSGRELLEKAISSNKENAEFRFLRLMIQENAPKILKYQNDIEADSSIIKEKYHSLLPDTKKFIREYSRSSTALNEGDWMK